MRLRVKKDGEYRGDTTASVIPAESYLTDLEGVADRLLVDFGPKLVSFTRDRFGTTMELSLGESGVFDSSGDPNPTKVPAGTAGHHRQF